MTLERRSVTAGLAVAAFTSGHRPPDNAELTGLSERRLYLLASVPFLVLSIYVLIGALGNYLRPDGYVAEIAWLLALSLILSALFGFIGAVLAMVSWQWPELSPTIRRLVASTPIGSLPNGEGEYRQPSARLNVVFAVTTAAAVFVAMVVGSSRGFLRRIDEPLLDAASDTRWIDAIARIDPLGSTGFSIAAAALLGLASFHCRPLILLYPIAFGAAFASNNLLKVIVERDRPPEGTFAGRFDSFPSGHMILTTILVGLVPLTIAVIRHSTRHIKKLQAIAAIAILMSATHRVHSEIHWPTDVLGGVLIGASIVLGVEWVVAHEAWHRRCSGCPWHERDESSERLGLVPLSFGSARILGIAGHALGSLSVIGLTGLWLARGFPRDPEGALIDVAIQRPAQLVLSGTLSIGVMISWRWVPVGAAMMAVSSTGLGMFAAVQYEPFADVAIALAGIVPAVLLWLSWQHSRSRGAVGSLALVTAGLVLATWVGATSIYGAVFGPTHQDSAAVVLSTDRVQWVWTGGLSPTSITVTARLADDRESARALVEGGGRRWLSEEVLADDSELVSFRFDGLSPGEQYTFVLDVEGELDRGRGRGSFRTPPDGAGTIRLVASSCARTDSNAAVFDAIAAEQPMMFLALGDAHYSNIAVNDPERYEIAYDRMLTQPGQAALFRNVPVSYVWDDHDYGPNDADGSSPSRPAARSVFRRAVPSHPLEDAEGAIHRAYSIGRVRFIVTDTRSERTDDTMLGEEQLAWFLDELVESSRTHGLVIWMNPTPWIGEAREGGDGWSGYAAERHVIAQTIADADIDNLLMVSGDAHMLAYDNGDNSGYAENGEGGFPVFHAAALDRPGNVKGGPYSGGTYPGFGQYGVLDLHDDGQIITVELTGKNWTGEVLISETLRFPA